MIAVGSHPDSRKYVFRGDENPLRDIRELFESGLGETGLSKLPKTLGYLMIEFEFTGDDDSDWGVVARVHHRSGANGLFSGRLDASNGWCLGIKYRF